MSVLIIFTWMGCQRDLPTVSNMLACPKSISLKQAKAEMEPIIEDVTLFGFHPNDSTLFYYQYSHYGTDFWGREISTVDGFWIRQERDLFDSTSLYNFAKSYNCTISKLDTSGRHYSDMRFDSTIYFTLTNIDSCVFFCNIRVSKYPTFIYPKKTFHASHAFRKSAIKQE